MFLYPNFCYTRQPQRPQPTMVPPNTRFGRPSTAAAQQRAAVLTVQAAEWKGPIAGDTFAPINEGQTRC